MSEQPTHYHVTASAAIMLSGGRILQPGSRVAASVIPAERVQEFLDQGWISTSAAGAKVAKPADELTGAGRGIPPVGSSDPALTGRPEQGNSELNDVPGATEAAKRALAAAQQRAAEAEAQAQADAEAAGEATEDDEEPSSAPSLGFAFDPDALIGRSADELRDMILAIDADMTVDGLDEADLISILSSEFEELPQEQPATELASEPVVRENPA